MTVTEYLVETFIQAIKHVTQNLDNLSLVAWFVGVDGCLSREMVGRTKSSLNWAVISFVDRLDSLAAF